jgi:uncharacterized protein
VNEAAIAPQAAPPAGRVWKFWGSLLWGILIFAVTGAAQLAVVFAFVRWRSSEFDVSELVRLSSDGVAVSLEVIAVAPVTLAMIALAVRVARANLADYLALRPFDLLELLLGLVLAAACSFSVDLVAWLAGHAIIPPFVQDTLSSATAAGALPLFVVAVALVAPLTEEFMVRGFLYRGFAASWLGPTGAIVLTSLLWASLHVQYDWFFIGEVFSLGLILGWMRRRSGSTWLTVVLHGVYNLIAVVQGMWFS